MADLINQEFVNSVIDTPYFQEALKAMPIETKIALRRVLNQGIVQQLGVRELVSSIRKVLSISFDKAERVIRTESHRVSEAGHNKEFLDSRTQEIDTKMQLIATLDDRTRPQSAQMDGQISNDEGMFEYPQKGSGNWQIPGNTGNPEWDINDRERSIQIIDGISPGIRRSREDGIIPFQNYETWAKSKGLKRNVYGQLLFP